MFSMFVLGAGFSKPAGLPLGSELFGEVLKRAKQTELYENILKRDIEYFLDYCRRVNRRSITEEEIDFEEFVSYLDIEHFLDLKGKDTWSSEGNRSQILIRNLIAAILYESMSRMKEQDYSLYESFVENLDPTDIIVTFNYDTIIEECLRKKGKPYRLFLDRLSEVNYRRGILDNSRDEIVLLKMHGSIDWFDAGPYDREHDYFRKEEYFQLPYHKIFRNPDIFRPKKIVEGPYFEDSLLTRIYRVEKLDIFFGREAGVTVSPLILSPSYSKTVYLDPLKELWSSFYSAGSLQKSVAIVGYSLSQHDDYTRLPLFSLIDNFQNYDPKIIKKSRLKIVDCRKTSQEIEDYKQRYPFVDWERTDCYFGGFDEKAIDILFEKDKD